MSVLFPPAGGMLRVTGRDISLESIGVFDLSCPCEPTLGRGPFVVGFCVHGLHHALGSGPVGKDARPAGSASFLLARSLQGIARPERLPARLRESAHEGESVWFSPREESAFTVYSHDPDLWPTFKHSPAYYGQAERRPTAWSYSLWSSAGRGIKIRMDSEVLREEGGSTLRGWS